MVTTRKAEPRPPIAGGQLLADLAELLVLAVVEIYQDTVHLHAESQVDTPEHRLRRIDETAREALGMEA